MRYDVIIVGGGHAGCEAAAAAARMGVRVALVTHSADTIGAMSCNPAIGGVGKGHLVRELDVFDGLMARAADAAGIHYRMLNRSKGAAVHGPRVQADRKLYRTAIQSAIGCDERIEVVEGPVAGLTISQSKVRGIELEDGTAIAARVVVLTTGTFLGGRIFQGPLRSIGGRTGDPASNRLAGGLRGLGLPIGRLKTGTPPRIDARTIDWARLGRQPSEQGTWCMSALGPGRIAPEIACGITRTNQNTHAIIRAAMDRSPLADGTIEGIGPRYCPSIEDKVARFGDRDGHQIFLEPEGLDDALVYPNGISTSLPRDAQDAMVRSIAGLEQARIVQHGYAVEYDYVDPRSLDHRLALRCLPSLFLAGQINGTTGYEEAAAQGLVAGLNAAREAMDREPILFARDTSYIGVLVDDLVLQGVSEPYRMLTARAEYRLRLRADNAPTRLGEQALASGAIGAERRAWLHRRAEALSSIKDDPRSVGDARLRECVAQEIEEDARYAPYVARQEAEVARLRANDQIRLDHVASFSNVTGLSSEMVERLEAVRPPTLAAASRIRGITPAALTALFVAARRAA